MIGAGSGEPEARRRRPTTVITAPPGSNAASQSQAVTWERRLPALATAAETFEPSATFGSHERRLEVVGRRSPLLIDRTAVERVAATPTRAGRGS
jgi:hypothetical protein